MGTPVPSTAIYKISGAGADGGRGTTRRASTAAVSASNAAAAAAPASSAARSTRLVLKVIPARSLIRAAAWAKGTAAPVVAIIARNPPESEAAQTSSSASRGTIPA